MADMHESASTPIAKDDCWLPRSRRSPALARRRLRSFLAGIPEGERLVNEAVLHSRVPGRMIWVGMEVYPDFLRLEVHDAGDGRPLRREVGVDEESGRGLLLVRALASRWGCCPRVGGIGKAVWVECRAVVEVGAGAE
jgi:hypothetical protein